MAKKNVVSFILILILNYSLSLRILCWYPIPYYSHQIVFNILTTELAKRGHQLVVLTPMPHERKIENVTEIDVHDISFKKWNYGQKKHMKPENTLTVDPISFWNMVYTEIYPMLDDQINSPEMQAILEDETQKFDLILVEECIRLAVSITAKYKAPVVLISTLSGLADSLNILGAEVNHLYFPDYFIHKLWGLSFLETLSELYSRLILQWMSRQMLDFENNFIRKNFDDDTSILDIRRDVQMMFLNVYHIWDNCRPVPSAVVYMGDIMVHKSKPLLELLQKFFDNSQNGVIYMSLGSKTMSSNLPPKTLETMMNVFKSLPYDVLWKWDKNELPGKPDNVRIEKWLPQIDMLQHPKLKLFISQAGLHSTYEAIAAKVPVIGLPLATDHFINGEQYGKFGIGVKLDINKLTEAEFRNVIFDVIENKSYRDNIEKLANIMEDHRAGSLAKTVYWIEYVAKYGTRQLRSPLADATLAEYYMLDVFGMLLIFAITAIGSVLYIVNTIIRKTKNLVKS